ESITAVENAEAILSTPGVDGCWVGPGDLAFSMGIHPKNSGQDERHARAVERALEACRNTGKIPGIACGSPEEAATRAAQGFKFLNAGGDMTLLMDAARAGLKTVGLSASRRAEGTVY
ncbi:MAG: 2,4-dihydroxyhept-2-ene-1,7-dioic acid aldolase, partial [Thermomicrobiales bacterium]|nr:2,4-dihydroxyhept-2-ene-1,7-dioic acid aldolase [Thermomicrobiales bacterium]